MNYIIDKKLPWIKFESNNMIIPAKFYEHKFH